MATTIKLKNSVTTTNAPSSLAQGEVAINVTDKKVWVGNAATTPVQLLGTGSDGSFTNLTVSGTTALNGGATLGDASGDALTINSSAVSIPNGLNFDSNTLVIDAANNRVGVNIATPAVALDVYSPADSIMFNLRENTSGNGRRIRFSNAGTVNTIESTAGIGATNLAFTIDGSEAMRIDSSRNVGIGTSSPAQKLDVQAAVCVGKFTSTTGTNAVYTQMVNTGGSFYLGTDDSVGGTSGAAYGRFVYGTGAYPMIFFTNATERMRIGSSGEVLFGATSRPSGVGGNFYVATTIATAAYQVRAGSSGAYSGNGFNINWTGSPQLWIDTTNLGTIQLASDYRIKRNIETQTAPALERVMALRPVTYQMADYGTLFTASEDIKEGFIAHEVQEVIPSGADGEKDAENQIQSLRVDAILAVAVKAIQEQQAIITDLKARIENLESK